MDAGRQQLDPAETPRVALEPEPAAAPVGPAVAPESAVPVGARAPGGEGAFKSALADAAPEQRERYVLQLQRTAGNAAVSRWLAAVGERYAQRMTGGEPPPDDVDAARPR